MTPDSPEIPIYDPAHRFLRPLVDILRRHPKRIVFAEGNDPRVLRVAAELVKTEAVAPILLGPRKEIHQRAREMGISLEFIGVVEPEHSDDFSFFVERYRRVERVRRKIVEAPAEVMAKPSYFAAMMVQYGYADGVVGGNQSLPAAWFRALFHLIGRLPERESVSSCLPIHLPGRPDLGTGGTLILGDCAVIPTPTVAQMAMTAVEAARAARMLLGERPRVAMISFSTRGSATNASTQKVIAATELAREQAKRLFVEMDIDGEVQIDTALDPATCRRKAPGSPLRGQANVLIFPDLTAAHSAFKLLELTAGGQPCGQLALGLSRPAAQVSRVCQDHTLFGAAICTAIRAVAYHQLIEAGLP